jgi:hypothetical protein
MGKNKVRALVDPTSEQLKAITIPQMRKAMAETAMADAKEIRASPAEFSIKLVGDHIEATKTIVQKDSKMLKHAGSSPRAMDFAEGVHTGLGYASKVVRSARSGRVMDHKGRLHKQRRGSVI